MLGTILGILKIIGIVILVLLGILLMLLLLVLFVPVRYRVKGVLDGKPKGMGEVSWLLHLLSCRVTYEEELDLAVRILGIRVGGNWLGEDTDEAEEDNGPFSETWTESEMDREATVLEEKALEEPDQDAVKQNEPVGEAAEREEPLRKEMKREAAGTPKEDRTETKAPRTQRSFWSRFRLKHIWKKIRVTFQKICGKLKILMSKRRQILEFLGKEENKRTFRNLKSQLKALLRHIRPRKLTGWLRFGFEDPSKTGQILTYVSPFYGLYAKHLTLIPVFEEEAMEGELDIKGRIRLAALIWIGIQVIRDKNFRTLLKKWKAV